MFSIFSVDVFASNEPTPIPQVLLDKMVVVEANSDREAVIIEDSSYFYILEAEYHGFHLEDYNSATDRAWLYYDENWDVYSRWRQKYTKTGDSVTSMTTNDTIGVVMLPVNFLSDSANLVYSTEDLTLGGEVVVGPSYSTFVPYADSTLGHIESFDGKSIMLSVKDIDSRYTSMSVRGQQLDYTGTYVYMNEEYTGDVAQFWPFYSDTDGYDSELATDFSIDYFVGGELVHEQDYRTDGYELVSVPNLADVIGSENPNFEYNYYGSYFTIKSLTQTYENVTVTHLPMGSLPIDNPDMISDVMTLTKGVEVPFAYGDFTPVFNDKYNVTMVQYGLLSTKVLDKFTYEYGVTTGGTSQDMGWYEIGDISVDYDWLSDAKQFVDSMKGLVTGFFSLMGAILAIAYGFPIISLIFGGLTAYISIRMALWIWSLVKP